MKKGKGLGALVLLAIIVGVVYLLLQEKPEGLPDLGKTVFVELTGQMDRQELAVTLILNNDNTGSLSVKQGSSGWQGTWELLSRNSEMIKIAFKSSSGGLVTLYKTGEASLAIDRNQLNGRWRQ